MSESTSISDWISFWDNFDQNLYIQYLIAKQNRNE
jgi:hypothetical protein